jgi:hypothetical protein
MNVQDSGVHSVERIDGRLQWVFRGMTVDELRVAGDAKRRLGTGGLTPEAAAAAVEPTSSALATILRSFEDHQGLIASISMLLAIIGILLPACCRRVRFVAETTRQQTAADKCARNAFRRKPIHATGIGSGKGINLPVREAKSRLWRGRMSPMLGQLTGRAAPAGSSV